MNDKECVIVSERLKMCKQECVIKSVGLKMFDDSVKKLLWRV